MLEILRLLFDPELNIVIRESLSGSMVQFLEIITILGHGALLFAFAALLYWFYPDNVSRKRIFILALCVMTLALVGGLKGILQVPRPELAFAPENYPGWSTPSAHAMGATAIYGGFATIKDDKLKILRYLGVGLLIFFIALSRVVIGVHYVGDVILGVILGILLVYLAIHIKRRRTIGMIFVVSLLISIGAYLLGSEEFITLSIGSSLGGFVSWNLVEYRIANPKCAANVIIMFMLIPIVIILWVTDAMILGYVGIADILVYGIPVQALFQIAGYAILFGLAVALPYLADMINHWDSVDRLEMYMPSFMKA